MTGERRLNIGQGAAAASVLAVLFVGAGGTYLMMRDRPASSSNTPSGQGRQPGISQAQPPGGLASLPAAANDVVVTLTKEGLDRAGIAVTPVTTQGVAEGLRLPGVVEPNAYRQVSVTPLVNGRVVSVSVQLGDHVRRGKSVAQVYSPEIAEARTKYVAARSMLDAH
jgi:cobalt-zinc-cadmium efflux system membrane fusion protein